MSVVVAVAVVYYLLLVFFLVLWMFVLVSLGGYLRLDSSAVLSELLRFLLLVADWMICTKK